MVVLLENERILGWGRKMASTALQLNKLYTPVP